MIKLKSTNNTTDSISDNLSNTIKTVESKPMHKAKFICVNCNKSLASLFSLNRHYNACKKTKTLLKLQKTNTIEKLLLQQKTKHNTQDTNNTHVIQQSDIVNNNLIPSPTKGIIYLIQPVELISTNRYKLGCSGKISLDRCITGYKKGSRYIFIQECFEPYKLETKLKLEFKQKFTLIAGTEYFAGDERQMKKIFNEITELHDTSYAIFYNSTLPNSQNTEIPETNAPNNLLLA